MAPRLRCSFMLLPCLALLACSSDDSGTRVASIAPIEAGAPSCIAQTEGCTCTESGTKALCSIKTHLDNGDTLCEGGEIVCGDDHTGGKCKGNGQTSVLKK